jgi:hypothetical protein
MKVLLHTGNVCVGYVRVVERLDKERQKCIEKNVRIEFLHVTSLLRRKTKCIPRLTESSLEPIGLIITLVYEHAELVFNLRGIPRRLGS